MCQDMLCRRAIWSTRVSDQICGHVLQVLPVLQLYDTAASVAIPWGHRRSSFPGPAAMYPIMAVADKEASGEAGPATVAAGRAAQQRAIAVAVAAAKALDKQQRAAAAKPWSALKLQQAVPPAAEEDVKVCQLCRRSKRPHAYEDDAAQPDGLAARCK